MVNKRNVKANGLLLLCIAKSSGNLNFEIQKTACKGNEAIHVYFIVSPLSHVISHYDLHNPNSDNCKLLTLTS